MNLGLGKSLETIVFDANGNNLRTLKSQLVHPLIQGIIYNIVRNMYCLICSKITLKRQICTRSKQSMAMLYLPLESSS